MNLIENALGTLSAGSVLDVATQEGGFIRILCEYLLDYAIITGIDLDPEIVVTAQSALGGEKIQFLVMDATRLSFEGASFNTVCISASLHHLDNPQQVLSEMVRVLKPGGRFILIEMHSSGRTETERTSIYLHQWVAEVDNALGKLHRPTLPRKAFLDYFACLNLEDIQVYDHFDRDCDAMEPKRINQLNYLIDSTIEKVKVLEGSQSLIDRGESLRRRLHSIGACREPVVLILARKDWGRSG